MLHIVQVVLSGNAEMPKVYSDEAAAQIAFVECAKKYWAQSYASYCERNAVQSDAFSSALAFVASFDLADKSRIHFWPVSPDGDDSGAAAHLPRLTALNSQREEIVRLAHDLDVASGAVRDGLANLAATIADLTGEPPATTANLPVGEPDAPRRFVAGDPSDSPTPTPTPTLTPAATNQPSAETLNTKEWKEYVETIKNMCGGNRSEFHLFTRHDWRQAVYGGEASLEYWQWVAVTIDDHIEKARDAGYTVIPDPDKPGNYRFQTPDGVVSDVSNAAEGEAWCRAGLHLKGPKSL